ncbi:hypothetical protein B566_EDAN013294 [Ephemera danica]|nr:hypothetical protein B566_EDAN013294 [Ephemera danica]
MEEGANSSLAVARADKTDSGNYTCSISPTDVKTDLMEEGANSSLAVARADKADSGNYTCSISPTENVN